MEEFVQLREYIITVIIDSTFLVESNAQCFMDKLDRI